MSRKKYRSKHPAGQGSAEPGISDKLAERRAGKHSRKKRAVSTNPISIPSLIIILAYILITTFTPNLMALDTNTPKFAALALVNLLAFVYLLFDNDMQRHPGYFGTFFTTRPGLAFTGLLFVALLSFTQANNLLESVIQFSKLFTVFSSAFILSVFFTRDLRFVRLAAIFFTLVLLFDAFSVFYYIRDFINGNIAMISEIKSVYSNKNILASALFVKIPFALWLMVYEKGWLRRLAWLAVMTGIAATFFMIARAFYVGLIIVTVLFTAYTLINYFRDREKEHLWLLGRYASALIIGLLIFSFVQSNFYPGSRQASASRNRQVAGVTEQLASITPEDGSTRIRLDAWNYSLRMIIRTNPLLGVGIGNWKISVLEHENQDKGDFIYLYKAHNDFLETATETGIVGGLLYLAIFVFVGWAFLRAFFNRKQSEALYKYLFLGAVGLIFFSFDAMFNFPHDRPEMMILLSTYVAVGVSASYYYNKTRSEQRMQTEDEHADANAKGRNEAFLEGGSNALVKQDLPEVKSWMVKGAGAISFALLLVVAWVLYTNFQSSITQRIAFQEIRAGALKTSSEEIMTGLPVLPNLSVWGESLRVLQARYLLHEEKFDEAIEMLRPDKSNPWDARREYFMAMSFLRQEEYDSVIKYTMKARELKPLYLNNMLMATDALERRGGKDKIEEMLKEYLSVEKRETRAWVAATNFYLRHDQLDKAHELIEEAVSYLPRDSDIQQQQNAINHRKFVVPFAPLFETAAEHFRAGRYQQALRYLDEYMDNVPEQQNALRLRAFCHYHTQAYQACIDDVTRFLEKGERDGSLINLRGASYRALGDMEAACRDFEESMQLGNDSGIENHKRFCEETGPGV